MVIPAARTTALALALVAAGNAFALGLGDVVGQAVIGQPLRIEIPLLGTGANLPAPDCFRIRPPVAEFGGDFTLRNARIQVVGERGGSKLIVTSTAVVREPLLGFAVAAGCGFELTKDYILLTALPTEAQPPVVTLPQPAPAPAPAPAPTPAPAPVAPQARPAAPVAPPTLVLATAKGGETLRVDGDVTLEGLARQKYPNQPKAREKFMRMMMQVNPALKDEASAIAAGTELQVPPGLPQRRYGPYLGETKAEPAPPPAPAVEQPVAVAPPPRPAKAANPAKDRLVLGAGRESNEAQLLAEAERLTALMMEQTKSQEALTETIAKLEGDYGELKQRFVQMEDRLTRIEAERLAEKQAPKPASFDFLELFLAVLAGGAVGGLALHGYQRLLARRAPAGGPAETPMAEAAPATGFRLPWAKPAAVAPAAIAPEVVAAEAIVPETAAAAAESVTELAAAVAGLSAAAAAAAHPQAPAVVIEAVPESTEPAPVAVTVESMPLESAGNASDLDSLSLEFSLEPAAEAELPAAAEEPPVEAPAPIDALAETLAETFAGMPAEAPLEALAAAPIETAAPAADAPLVMEPLALDFPPIVLADAASGEAPAAEALPTLDFPPISGGAAVPLGADPHVVEFVSEAAADTDAEAQGALDFRKTQ